MHIDLFSDMVCPWCRIGKKNMDDAIAAWKEKTGETITVTYRAYQLDPTLPPEGKPFRETMEAKFGSPERLNPMLQRVTDAGAEIGLTFRFDQVQRMPNTLMAHRVTAILPEQMRHQWVDAVMKAYFEDGKDLSSRDVLLEVAESIGADADQLRQALDGDGGLADVQNDLNSAQGIGITGVPFFVIDGRYALSGAYPVEQFLTAFQRISQGA